MDEPVLTVMLNRKNKFDILRMFGTVTLDLQGHLDNKSTKVAAAINFSLKTSLSKDERPCTKGNDTDFTPNKYYS